MTEQSTIIKFKNTVTKTLKIATPFSGVFAVVSDLCSPLGEMPLYFLSTIFISFIVASCISLVILAKKGIQAFYQAKSTIVASFCLVGTITMSISYFFTSKNPEVGFIGSNIEIVSELQNKIFSKLNDISDKQDKVLESQKRAEKDIQKIKEVVTGDSELKNMTTTEDLTVAKELNERTKHKDAKRLAIIYFDNTSEEKNLNKLKKGLASMLISDLSNIYMLEIVERDRLEEILKEQKMNSGNKFDQTTSSKVGKLLGAEMILTGSYFEMFGSFRIDARFIDVETGKILKSEGVDGASDNFFKLQKQLTWKIIKNLDIKLSEEENASMEKSEIDQEISYAYALMYSEALNDIDSGDVYEAINKLKKLLDKYPNFEPAKKELKKLEINV